jgi:hypothetical protein
MELEQSLIKLGSTIKGHYLQWRRDCFYGVCKDNEGVSVKPLFIAWLECVDKFDIQNDYLKELYDELKDILDNWQPQAPSICRALLKNKNTTFTADFEELRKSGKAKLKLPEREKL